MVLVGDPDWDTLVIDAPDRQAFRNLRTFFVDQHSHGWAGRQTYRLLHDAGLSDLKILTVSPAFTDFGIANSLFDLERMADEGEKAGVVTREQADAFNEALRASVAGGYFFAAILGVCVVGRKPL
jgi:hypothetical protein